MDPPDDLSAIRGIGRRRAQWLTETLGVRSPRDLAALSLHDLEEGLRATAGGRVLPTRTAIESWLRQARVLAAETVHEPDDVAAAPSDGVEASGPQVAAETVAPPPAAVEVEAAPADAQVEGAPAEAIATESAAVEAAAVRPPIADLQASVADGDGVEPVNLIRIDKPWAVVFTWSTESATQIDANDEWWLDVVCRPLAGGQPLTLAKEPVRVPVDPSTKRHRHSFEVPIGVVTVTHCETWYRSVATLMHSPKDFVVARVAGAVDLGVLRFYKPVPEVMS